MQKRLIMIVVMATLFFVSNLSWAELKDIELSEKAHQKYFLKLLPSFQIDSRESYGQELKAKGGFWEIMPNGETWMRIRWEMKFTPRAGWAKGSGCPFPETNGDGKCDILDLLPDYPKVKGELYRERDPADKTTVWSGGHKNIILTSVYGLLLLDKSVELRPFYSPNKKNPVVKDYQPLPLYVGSWQAENYVLYDTYCQSEIRDDNEVKTKFGIILPGGTQNDPDAWGRVVWFDEERGSYNGNPWGEPPFDFKKVFPKGYAFWEGFSPENVGGDIWSYRVSISGYHHTDNRPLWTPDNRNPTSDPDLHLTEHSWQRMYQFGDKFFQTADRDNVWAKTKIGIVMPGGDHGFGYVRWFDRDIQEILNQNRELPPYIYQLIFHPKISLSGCFDPDDDKDRWSCRVHIN